MNLSTSCNRFNQTETEARDQEGVETSLSLPSRFTSDDDNDIEIDAAAAEAIPNDDSVTSYKRYGIIAGSAILLTLLVAAAAAGGSVAGKNRVAEQAKATLGTNSKASKTPKSSKSPKSAKMPKGGTASPTAAPTAVPTAAPTRGYVSCVSGDTGVFKVNDDNSVTVITLKEAESGDKVKGLDANLNDAVCEVEALGYWGKGDLYGNYTASHYVYDKSSGDIVEHGEVGDYSFGDKFILLSDCPLVLDETEQAFTPLDSDVNYGPEQGGNIIAWDDYVNVYNSFVGLVDVVGACVMDQEGYADLQGWTAFSVVLNDGYKECVENGGDDCIAAVNLREEALKFYAEPCKSSYLSALQPLRVLRDAGDTDTIQQLSAGQSGRGLIFSKTYSPINP